MSDKTKNSSNEIATPTIRRRRESITLASIESQVLEWLHRSRGLPNEDLMAEMLHTLIRLNHAAAERGDLKILNRTLRELRYAFKVFAPYRSVRKASIFGSGRVRPDHPYYQLAAVFTRRLAEEGWMVITGGGEGIMAAGHEGAGRQQSFGVNIQLPFVQEPNSFIRDDAKLMTFHFFFTRKLIFVKEADAFVFFPGGFGTHDELIEVLTLAQTGKSQLIPILLLDLPNQNYWREWEDFVRRRMLEAGFISEQDLSLFKIVEDPEAAVAEIQRFYRRYHSYRFVKRDLVVRLRERPTPALIDKLNREFRELLTSGGIRETPPLPEEADDPDTLAYPRLLVPFNRRDFGRLRGLIDVINQDD